MKVRCPLSGVEFKAQGFGILQVKCEHPLLSASLIDLLRDVLPLYYMDKLNEPEIRVLFVAFLKHSELVDFEHHAAPSLKTIHSNMQALVKTLDWSLSHVTVFSLPRYKVTRDNCTLRNITQWISSWAAARDNWIDRQQLYGEKYHQSRRQEALEKLILNAYRTPEQYAGRLAKWALEASEAHPDRIEEWTTIFKLREPAVYNVIYREEIEDLYDHLARKLDAVNNTVAQTAIKHIKKIRYLNREGILHGLDDFDDEDVQLFISRDQGTPYIMKSRHERMVAATVMKAPSAEPKASDYSARHLYLVARARWEVKLAAEAATSKLGDSIRIARAPISITPTLEDKTLVDAAFDNDEAVDESEGTYEEIVDDIVLAALNAMNSSSEQEAAPISKANVEDEI